MAGDLVLPDVRGYDFGVGIDRLSENPRNQVVKPTSSPPMAGNGANQKFDVSRIMSTRELQTKLGIDIAASYGCAAFGAGVSARFQYLNESSVHSSTLFLAITASVQMANLSIDQATLSTNAGRMVDNPPAFDARYGEMFCRACTRGGLFVGLLRIETTSSTEATSISASLKGSYGLFDADAKASFSEAITSTNASVYCSLYVEGGPPIQIINPNDANEFLQQANLWIKGIQEDPDAYARPYEWTMSPISIAEGPLPPNAADLQQAADVLAQCARERLSLLDERNEMAWYRDHWDQYDATQTPITQQQVSDHHTQNQHDLDLLARCASAAMDHPRSAVSPETFAAAQDPPDTYREHPVPTPLPRPSVDRGGGAANAMPNLVGQPVGPVLSLLSCLSMEGVEHCLTFLGDELTALGVDPRELATFFFVVLRSGGKVDVPRDGFPPGARITAQDPAPGVLVEPLTLVRIYF